MKPVTEEQGAQLIRLARDIIAERLGLTTRVSGAGLDGEELRQRCGTFVTLKRGGQLRGCIGNLEPAGTIVDAVRRNAVSAAFQDYRFAPLTAEEFPQVEVEISILTPAQKLSYNDGDDLAARLHPGIDGVIMQLGSARATFLPQVWEQLPEPAQFLEQLCRKAGIAPSAWRHQRPEIFVYQVRSFAEHNR
ncbi:AmmeMemoRadiSam system protein A [Desulfofustis limnaeus]|uniref:TIGR00296 family protein n=1 Tax=Desulfofustis limnaeus TaxID=2740163 RepID=A0ABM7WDJ2_9BACT|nr:AmmeMemoRadiSam system protein A [Desulfofustis limnaeus]MDX9896329.1 AmmeMemoRadiSam system protein A [Desulfofustis sp.]BDD89072.1 TIGR00296 family protein [Desulfofustis limnaeus]